jgi:WD40 repeat protein
MSLFFHHFAFTESKQLLQHALTLVRTGSVLSKLSGHTDVACHVAFSPASPTVRFGREVYLESTERVAPFPCAGLQHSALLDVGSQLISGSADGFLREFVP